MKLEIYFDYLCEFCEDSHQYLSALLPRFPQITPVWRPCEAHPRASEPHYGQHSDLATQGLFFLLEHGGDVLAFNTRLFDAFWHQGENPQDISLLARYAGQAGVDPAAFEAALKSRAYEPALHAANARAWGALAISAVPCFILENGQRLDSRLGVGVPKAALEAFLRAACRGEETR